MRIGVTGCGVIGAVHAQAIDSLPQAHLAAVADIPEAWAAAESMAQRYHVHAYRGLAEMLASEAIDVINICTPSGLHASQSIEAMRAGSHVIVEKPMALTLPDADEMIRVSQESGVRLAVVSQHRFDSDARRLRKLIESEALGRISLAVAHVPWWRSQAYYDKAAWRGTIAMDGGVLMNQAIHSVDLLLWLLGPVASVTSFAETRAHDIEAEDVVAASLRFESGAIGSITATTGAFPGFPARLEILGDAGSAVVENDHLVSLVLSGEDGQTFEPQPEPPFGAAHRAQIADMIDAIHAGRQPYVDGIEGRRSISLILAILEAANAQHEVIPT
ncbi:MAG TPA: Gfo/Idh/MocA family oxidoreductase [Chloroflexota bacterium]|nr:Gfo/Idh/MocA family oxidoreductase [Chloroflexota bacterium]